LSANLENQFVYLAARAGVENMTKSLAQEWMDHNVRINCVRPGVIWTNSGFANYGAAGDEFSQEILPTLPTKRYGTAEEISSAVIWLLCDGSRYVTGQVLSVCGGSSFTSLPLHEISNEGHLLPAYGVLPPRAKL
jgi:peroxisomal trans-2-enoyl-CoA reductase